MKQIYLSGYFMLCFWFGVLSTCYAQTTLGDSIAAKTASEDLIFSEPYLVPRFYDPTCEQLENYSEKKKCAEESMLRYIYHNLEYPDHFFTEEAIQGMVVIGFTVEKNGTIHSIVVQRDIGEGYGEAALKVVENMPNWVPGTMHGKPFPCQFNLPIRFKIEDL
ncbi:MAG: TonB family protein [Bacteroidota bacterium]